MKKIIGIVGGAGFLGTRLANRLDKSGSDYAIYDIDKSNEATIKLDVEDVSSLRELAGCDVLINLAAVHRDDVKPLTKYDDVNVTGAKNLCNAARQHGISKIVFTSSVAIYGFAKAGTDENGAPNYFNDYGRTKYLAEQVYKAWYDEDPGKRMLFIVRPTVIFGEGNRGNVYNLLKQIATGRFVMFGGGKNIKSMAYVENVAAFLGYASKFESGYHVYNYIDKPDFDMNYLVSKARSVLFGVNSVGLRLPAFLGSGIGVCADLLAKLLGKSLPVSKIRVKKFMSTTQFATSIKNLDFVPPIRIEDGLERTLRYEFLEDNQDKRTFVTE